MTKNAATIALLTTLNTNIYDISLNNALSIVSAMEAHLVPDGTVETPASAETLLAAYQTNPTPASLLAYARANTEVQAELAEGKVIGAIKVLRAATLAGLVEAKNAVDTIRNTR